MTDVPRLYRVILQVSDLDQGAEFYSKLLGTEGRRIRGGFRHYFDCGEVILALLDPSAFEINSAAHRRLLDCFGWGAADGGAPGDSVDQLLACS